MIGQRSFLISPCLSTSALSDFSCMVVRAILRGDLSFLPRGHQPWAYLTFHLPLFLSLCSRYLVCFLYYPLLSSSPSSNYAPAAPRPLGPEWLSRVRSLAGSSPWLCRSGQLCALLLV